jgi:hypothetical protein
MSTISSNQERELFILMAKHSDDIEQIKNDIKESYSQLFNDLIEVSKIANNVVLDGSVIKKSNTYTYNDRLVNFNLIPLKSGNANDAALNSISDVLDKKLSAIKQSLDISNQEISKINNGSVSSSTPWNDALIAIGNMNISIRKMYSTIREIKDLNRSISHVVNCMSKDVAEIKNRADFITNTTREIQNSLPQAALDSHLNMCKNIIMGDDDEII